MKNIFIFMGTHGGPAGGMDDFVAAYDSEEQAEERLRDELESGTYNWAHFVDTRGKGKIKRWFFGTDNDPKSYEGWESLPEDLEEIDIFPN